MSPDSGQDRSDWYCDRVQSHLQELYATARRLTGNAADAEDLVAEAVARGWANRDTLADPEAFRGWIFRILTNAFISQKRKSDARPEDQSFDEAAHPPDPFFSLFDHLHQPFLLWWSNPEQAFLRRLLREDLERAVDGLPEEFRAAVVLCDLQGLSYREVADALEIPMGTVKSRLARGRGLLQKALWNQARDAGLLRASAAGNADPN